MNIKLFLLSFFLLSSYVFVWAQDLRIKKGVVVDSLKIIGTPSETFALYLPENFENKNTWPLLVVVDPQGKGKKALSMFVGANQGQDYILAASNMTRDSLSLSENVQRIGRLFTSLSTLFPLNKNRLFVAGFDSGARMANVLPLFFKNLKGVISCGATINNLELIDAKNPYHYIGIVGRGDFAYNEMLATEDYFNKLKFDNNILVFEGARQWPETSYLTKSLHYLTLRSMAREFIAKDSAYIQNSYRKIIDEVHKLKSNNQLLLAYRELKEIQNAFRDLMDTDSVENAMRELRKDKMFRSQKRKQDEAFFKESFLKEDYQYALDEDIQTFNYNNLGWWNYQMTKLREFTNAADVEEQLMGKRLIGFINALIEDSIDFNAAQEEAQQDDEKLIFLSMLKTITEPDAHEFYLDVISLSAKYEEYGTAIFYLEELLKKGYSDRAKIYALPHTALLKITPEFNEIVGKYLDSARYEIKE